MTSIHDEIAVAREITTADDVAAARLRRLDVVPWAGGVRVR
jgi:hypothetical protein